LKVKGLIGNFKRNWMQKNGLKDGNINSQRFV